LIDAFFYTRGRRLFGIVAIPRLREGGWLVWIRRAICEGVDFLGAGKGDFEVRELNNGPALMQA
jgi:hypothetical protein